MTSQKQHVKTRVETDEEQEVDLAPTPTTIASLLQTAILAFMAGLLAATNPVAAAVLAAATILSIAMTASLIVGEKQKTLITYILKEMQCIAKHAQQQQKRQTATLST